MKKIFNQKNFNYFVLTPLGSRVNIYINFCLQVHFKVSAAWCCCHYLPPAGVIDTGGKFAACVIDTGGNLPPASLTPVANLPPVSLTLVANLPPVSTTLAKMVAKFATGVVDTGGKFAAGVVDNGGKFAPGVVDNEGKFATGVIDTGGAPWPANISANFRKFEMVLIGYSGAGGKLIHGKKTKQKISWHCPFNKRDQKVAKY
jgi:hypothetical protein